MLNPVVPNLVPAGIFLQVKTFANAHLDFCMSKPTKIQIFYTQNGPSKNLPATLFCIFAQWLNGWPALCYLHE
jgi:hypothetical protein